VRLTAALAVCPSLVALMVNVWTPRGADEEAVSVSVLAPVDELLTLAGESAAVTPFGNPVTDRLAAAL
jgi:hypothetical protein